MEKNIKKIICSAIQSKQIIQFNYEDGTRIVEPYCCGLTKDGNEVLRAYQIKGQSKSGKLMGWKLFKVPKIKDLEISDKYFAIGHYYSKEPVIKTVYCCI